MRTVECAGHVQLIWFLPSNRSYLYDPQELKRYVQLNPVVERDDGVIYDVRPRGSVARECPP